jgi:hypothetical protein
MKANEVIMKRHENIDTLFNREAALLAIKNTPKKVTRGGNLGDFKSAILQIFEAAGKGVELSLNQVKAAYEAATKDTTKTAKNFADNVWYLSDKNKNCKEPKLTAGASTGTYVLK